MIRSASGVITVAMKLAVVLVLALGAFACGGKKSSSATTSPTPEMTPAGMNATGGSTYGGNAYGGSKYGGAR